MNAEPIGAAAAPSRTGQGNRLRIGVYNRFWPTAGGGEKFAGGIAQALATQHDVELIGHGSLDLHELGSRLQLDLSGVGWRAIEVSPSAVEAASADYEVFVNVSYGSVLRNRARHGLYVVHFPTIGAPPPTGWRRFALRAAGRLAKMSGTELEPARWTGGVYSPEPLGPLTHRWTDGDGVLQIDATHAGQRATLVCARLVGADDAPIEVRVSSGEQDGPARPDGSVSRRRRRVALPLGFVPFRVGSAHPAAGAPGESTSNRPEGRAHGESTSNRQLPLGGTSGTGSSVAGITTHVRTSTHAPAGRSSDHRLLGVSVVAVLVGSPWRQLLQLVHQPLSAAAAELSFLDSYQRVVANSRFTAEWVRRLWAIDAGVLNPPVGARAPGDKAPMILHVGRFFPPAAGHSKRQLELVGAFGRLLAGGGADGWRLHLVGGCDEEGAAYLDQVRAAIGELPVELHVNASGDELRRLYGEASIYWHGTGLGEDPEAHPERMEHFGIATVEAMSAAAVPVAIGLAGQLEVFDDGVEGYHFDDLDQLIDRTAALIANPEGRAVMSAAARRRAERYGEAAFRTQLLALVDELTEVTKTPNSPASPD